MKRIFILIFILSVLIGLKAHAQSFNGRTASLSQYVKTSNFYKYNTAMTFRDSCIANAPFTFNSGVSFVGFIDNGSALFYNGINVQGGSVFFGNAVGVSFGALAPSPPFGVSSSIKVPNLNANYLGGYTASSTSQPNTIPVLDGNGLLLNTMLGGNALSAADSTFLRHDGVWAGVSGGAGGTMRGKAIQDSLNTRKDTLTTFFRYTGGFSSVDPSKANSVRIGDTVTAVGAQGIAIGNLTNGGTNTIVEGYGTIATGSGCTLVGVGDNGSSFNSLTGLGSGISETADYSTIVGVNGSSSGLRGTGLGYGGSATATDAMYLGAQANAIYQHSTALGAGALTDQVNEVHVGIQDTLHLQNGWIKAGNVLLNLTTFPATIARGTATIMAHTQSITVTLAGVTSSSYVIPIPVGDYPSGFLGTSPTVIYSSGSFIIKLFSETPTVDVTYKYIVYF